MKLFSRFAALALALALCLSILPAAVAEDVTQDKNQIVEAGGTVFYNDKGDQLKNIAKLGDKVGDDVAVVEMTKTVSQPEDYQENEFEITLQVKTTSRIDTIGPVSNDAAVLLIIDRSSSMDNSINSNQKAEKGQSRLDAAKKAAKDFIKQFSELEGDGKRMVALVTFGGHASSFNWASNGTPVYWINIQNTTNSNATNNGLNKVNNEIDKLYAYSSRETAGGTNLEAALMLGRNLLADGQTKTPENGGIKDIQHVYTILLTDGKPTYHVPNHENNLVNLAAVYGPNRFNSEEDTTGSSTEYDDVVNVGIMANGSKDGTIKGITDYSKLYSICFGRKDAQHLIYNEALNETNSYWDVTIQKNSSYRILKDKTKPNNDNKIYLQTVGEWLSAFSSAKAYDAQTDDTSGLFNSFNSIITHIKLSAKAWQVDDKMGENIQFLSYVNTTYTDSTNHEHYVENSASLPSAENNNTLHWNLLSSEPDPNITVIKTGEGETSIVGYTYKYKVRLNNLDGDYKAGVTATPTNESATLKYAVLKDGVFQANPNNTDGTYTGTFPQPMVKGLVGNLTFKKVDGSGTALPGATFTLSSVEKNADGTSKWSSATATSGDDGTVTFSNIPSGHSYTLTETKAPDNYNLDSTPHTVEIKYGKAYKNDEQITETNPLKITNTAKTGSLTISKAFGEGSAITADSFPTGKTITFTVKKADDSDYASFTLPENGKWEKTLTNVPLGTYTVTEGNATIDGYTLSTTVTGLTSDSKVTITSGQAAEVAFTNTYERDTGSLTITKEFSGLPEGTSAPNISFTVTGPDGYTKTFKRSEMTLTNGKYSYTINDLPTGEYTVTEDANTTGVSNYTLSTTYSPTDGKVTVSKGNEAKVSITNTYTQDVGSLTVSKAWSYKLGTQPTPAPSNAPTQVTVNVVGPTSTSAILNAGNGWSTTIPNLPVGEYTITEEQNGLSIEGWTLTVTGGNPATSPVPVTKGETATAATITNTYERDTGKLTITKANEGATPESVKFKVTGPDGYSAEVTLPIVGADGSKSWSKTLENLPTGTYTIAESGANVDGYSYTTKVKVNNGTESENTSTSASVTKGGEATVAFTNTYTQNKGGLAISKKFNFVTPSPMVGTVTTPAPSDRPEIVVEVKDANSQPVATALLNQGNNWSTTIPDLPVGEYTITEMNNAEYPLDITGWTLATPAPTTVTVASNTTAPTVEITNTYTRDTGSLTITKTISGLPDGTTPDIFFTVTGPDSYSETIYLKADQTQTDRKAMSMAADGTYSYQINNLPTGEYTVTETNAAVTDYSLSATVSVNGKPAQTLPANGVTVEVKAGEDNTATVVFTNTYSSTLGSLTIKKEFVNLSDNSKPQFIIIQVLGPTNSNFETTVTLNAANHWTDTIGNLPAGDYTVSENTDNAILRGYNLTTTVKVGNGNAKAAAGTIATVPAGGNVTVTFTNAYELKEAKKIELPITKKVKRGEKGNVDPTGARTFTFEAQIEELILASLDDTPAVQPSEIVVQFNGETLTPKDNRYAFSITVNGAGKETGTLTIFTNEVSNLIVNVHELSQTDSGYAEDECWKYDESRYVFYPSIKDGINDKDYSLNGVHVITDEESFQLSEDDSITFTNVYTKTSTPEIDVPVTGDNSRIGLYMAMMLLSAAGLAVICKRRTAKR